MNGRQRQQVNEQQVLFQLSSRLKSGVSIKDRKWRLKVCRNCFVGSEAVQFLLDSKEVKSVDKAVMLCQMLLQANIIRHVSGKSKFKNEYVFYVFVGDNTAHNDGKNSKSHKRNRNHKKNSNNNKSPKNAGNGHGNNTNTNTNTKSNTNTSGFRAHRKKGRKKNRHSMSTESYKDYDINDHQLPMASASASAAMRKHTPKSNKQSNTISVPQQNPQRFSNSLSQASDDTLNTYHSQPNTDPNIRNGMGNSTNSNIINSRLSHNSHLSNNSANTHHSTNSTNASNSTRDSDDGNGNHNAGGHPMEARNRNASTSPQGSTAVVHRNDMRYDEDEDEIDIDDDDDENENTEREQTFIQKKVSFDAFLEDDMDDDDDEDYMEGTHSTTIDQSTTDDEFSDDMMNNIMTRHRQSIKNVRRLENTLGNLGHDNDANIALRNNASLADELRNGNDDDDDDDEQSEISSMHYLKSSSLLQIVGNRYSFGSMDDTRSRDGDDDRETTPQQPQTQTQEQQQQISFQQMTKIHTKKKRKKGRKHYRKRDSMSSTASRSFVSERTFDSIASGVPSMAKRYRSADVDAVGNMLPASPRNPEDLHLDTALTPSAPASVSFVGGLKASQSRSPQRSNATNRFTIRTSSSPRTSTNTHTNMNIGGSTAKAGMGVAMKRIQSENAIAKMRLQAKFADPVEHNNNSKHNSKKSPKHKKNKGRSPKVKVKSKAGKNGERPSFLSRAAALARKRDSTNSNSSVRSSDRRSRKKKKNGGTHASMKPYGGGHMSFSVTNQMPYHLQTFFDIQKELNTIRQQTSKKKLKMQIELINTRLHTLFFSNESTHLPNMQAFQKFFVDRMSHVSVHKDLDWHICLVRPRMHSKLHAIHIRSVVSCVSDLLRKSIKKFNHRRGHITSSANTHSLGVSLYGGRSVNSSVQNTPSNLFVGNNNNNGGFPSISGNSSEVSTDGGGGGGGGEFSESELNGTPKRKRKKHRKLLSFGSRKQKKMANKQSHVRQSESTVIQLGASLNKLVKGSAHANHDEPYPLELFHVSDMDFILVYYVKFLRKFEKTMVEFIEIYESFANISDDVESDTALQMALVGSNPRETYLESLLKSFNTIQYGRQSSEHPWIKVQTDKRKSQKFGQDLIYMTKFMKSNDIERLHELMKQIPDFNARDRDTQKTALEISLGKSVKQPSFAFVARYLALKQLLNNQKLDDERVIVNALETNNPMVAEILLHLDPKLSARSQRDQKTCLDLALHRNYRNLACYMLKLNVPEWHTQQLIRRWTQGSETGDCVKLRSVLQRGFNIDYFQSHDQKTALITCTENSYRDCVEFLVQEKANLNALDLTEKTALHYAAESLDGPIFRILLEARASWHLKDLERKTPMDYVMQNIGFIAQKKPKTSFTRQTSYSVQGSLMKLQSIGKSKRNLAPDNSNTSPRYRGNSSWNVDSNAGNSNNPHVPISPSMRQQSSDEIKSDSDEDSWDEYSYLVTGDAQPPATQAEDDKSANMSPSSPRSVSAGAGAGASAFPDVDVQQVVQILDVVAQSGVPLDSRLLLLAVQRDWPHVILVLCQAKSQINVDVQGKDGITPLMLAAREGRKACLSALLQASKPDVDLADSAERTPLMHAAYRSEAECVSRLLKAGANIDIETVDGTTLLMAACYGGLDDFAKYLIENGADCDAVNENGFSALLFASSEGYQEVVNVLLDGNASIDITSGAGLTPLMAACSGSLHELVLYVLARISRAEMDAKDENGWTALMHAVASSAEKCAAILLKAGASVIAVGEDGYSLLSIAIMGNLIWMVRHILEMIRKMIVNDAKHSNNANNKPSNGTTVRQRLDAMFNTRENINGFGCVHEACGIGAEKCLSLLLEYNEKYFGGDLILFDLEDLNGRTPLMIACLNGQTECIQLLLTNPCANINPQKSDNAGHSSLVYGIESGDAEILLCILNNCKNNRYTFSQKTIRNAKQAAMMRGLTAMVDALHSY